MKTILLTSAIAISLCGASSAAVTLTFNGIFGFFGESGQTSGITWGVVVDTGSDGFDSGLWTGVNVTDGSLFGGSANDILYLGDNPTSVLVPGVIEGVIGNASSIGAPGVTPFGVIWFDSTLSSSDTAVAGDAFGFTGFVGNTPPDSGTLNYSATGGTASSTFVPEPSTALLCAMGALGLLRRRR